MLNPRWAVLVVTPLAMCLIVRASQTAQPSQEPGSAPRPATPKKILSQLKQAPVGEPARTPVRLPKIPPPDLRAALLPPGFVAEVVLADLTYPSSVEFDDGGTPCVAEADYNYGDDAAPAVSPDGGDLEDRCGQVTESQLKLPNCLGRVTVSRGIAAGKLRAPRPRVMRDRRLAATVLARPQPARPAGLSSTEG